MEIITNSAEETKNLAKKLAGEFKGGEVVALYGDLGAGKTTFVQGFAEGMNITSPILSPTFVLRRSYGGKLQLNHYDFYRLNSSEDVTKLAVEEDINPDTVTIIEWPDKVNFEHTNMKRIYFNYLEENKRKIRSEDIS